ncbi:DUF983 domain-containing protein [Sphingomonas sp. JC676]|uniref:DUF983 domain-containing protein n=1 Tax=Sphingomonas sp. JC676 TaxID=2768065 RepID=UPI001657E431|nr:DUF983 domain-containing protein [Sphingomonas sp. JC676]MBC9034277.1 DUF983 domain-containing protein [Sphingomonas sp. JC676]
MRLDEQPSNQIGGGGTTPPPPIDSGLKGCCPRCGTRTLFAGYIRFADKCANCGLDFTQFNVGDGPVVFLTLGIGALVTMMALWVEFTFQPGLLIHILLWVPITLGLTVVMLRFSKGLLLALEYRHKAAEGRIKDV